jgi:hypothetical protein
MAGRPEAGSRSVPGAIQKSTVVDDKPVRVLADDRSLHAVVENVARATFPSPWYNKAVKLPFEFFRSQR